MSSGSDADRKRVANFSTLEINYLVECVKQHQNIIENKMTHAVTTNAKKRAWTEISDAFKQTLIACNIPKSSLRKYGKRNSIFADHWNCSVECRAVRYKIAEYLVNFDYEMNNQLIRELDPQLGNEGYVCPMRKKSDKFYSAHIFARSTAWSVEHCALMCLRLPECHSYNHVDYAKVCYYSKGPYRVAKKPSTVTNEKFYAPSSYIALARHFTFACRKQNNQEKDFRRRSGLHLNNNFYPGKPSFKPAERPSFDQREGHFYQVPHSSPWMVNLKIKKERCSGVLVPSSRFNTSQSDLILTAARCVTIPKSANPVLAEDVEVQFGKNNLRIQEYSFVA
uniref:Regulatory protein zeste n=1 Tax=Romanomermis culicivorax TaxID=13658 RepID=A0A915L2D2_ROMCU